MIPMRSHFAVVSASPPLALPRQVRLQAITGFDVLGSDLPDKSPKYLSNRVSGGGARSSCEALARH